MTDDLASSDLLRDLFDDAPCGYVVLTPTGRIRAVNARMAAWVQRDPDSLIGGRFVDLLTVGARIHYETHFAPILLGSGVLGGIAVELLASDRSRIQVLVQANVKKDDTGRLELIRLTAHDATDRLSYERELLDERHRAQAESRRAVGLAETLRRSLLPPSLSPPPGLDAAAFYQSPSNVEVGGDFFDLFPLSHNRYGFFLGDVCGKGVVAAALTSLTRYTLRAAAVNDEDPVGVLHTLDTVLKQDVSSVRGWCTVLYGSISQRPGGFDVEIASGGHPPPLLVSPDGTVSEVPTMGGQAVGLFAEPTFTSAKLLLPPGATLVMYTDGLAEARTGLGTQRYDDDDDEVSNFVAAQVPTTAVDVVAALRTLIGKLGAGVEDDVAVLALGVPL